MEICSTDEFLYTDDEEEDNDDDMWCDDLEKRLFKKQTPTDSAGRVSSSSFSVSSMDTLSERLGSLPPLGLNLRKSPSLQNMVEIRLSQRKFPEAIGHSTDMIKPEPLPEKLKASNFPVSKLSIGKWQRVSRNEGDLVAKCYFAKKKLVWELLDRGLKSKIEIQWADVMAIRAEIQENQPGILKLELSQPPSFYHELDPQPRKHTQWKLTLDFTGGQASLCRRHFLHFPPGVLDKNYEKLLQCDNNLSQRSQIFFPSMESPYFEANMYGRIPGFPFQLTRQISQINPGFQFSCNPPIPMPLIPRLQPEFSQYAAQPSLGIKDESSPVSVMSHIDEAIIYNPVAQNPQTWRWSYETKQNSADHLLHTQANILESNAIPSQTNHANFYQTSDLPSLNEPTLTTIGRPENGVTQALKELENQLLDDSTQPAYPDETDGLAKLGSWEALINWVPESGDNTNVRYNHTQDMTEGESEKGLKLNEEFLNQQVGSEPNKHSLAPAQFSYDENGIVQQQMNNNNGSIYPFMIPDTVMEDGCSDITMNQADTWVILGSEDGRGNGSLLF